MHKDQVVNDDTVYLLPSYEKLCENILLQTSYKLQMKFAIINISLGLRCNTKVSRLFPVILNSKTNTSCQLETQVPYRTQHSTTTQVLNNTELSTF